MDIRPDFVSKIYEQAKNAEKHAPVGFGQAFEAFSDRFADALVQGEQTAKAALISEADPHALVEALAATEMAVETVVTVRDKVVEAYQEILRMPV